MVWHAAMAGTENVHAEVSALDESRFAYLLKTCRRKRRLSQLDLALSSGISQRHVSFLETGRAKPSREMILQLSEILNVPLRERNNWLTAAGFAPAFPSRALEHPQMTQVLAAVRMMLSNHEPFPAIAIDRAWNIRLSNNAFDRFSNLTGADLWTRMGGTQRNLMRLLFHPNGIKTSITNWRTIAPLLWHRAQREAETLGGREMQQVLLELAPYQDAETLRAAEDMALVPLLSIQIDRGDFHLSLFNVIATFGTAQDVIADELRMEFFFPGDELTGQLFRDAARQSL